MDQQRLFRLAVEAIAVNAHRGPDGSWQLVIRTRRGDELWADVDGDTYDHLSTTELADVVSIVLAGELGL